MRDGNGLFAVSHVPTTFHRVIFLCLLERDIERGAPGSADHRTVTCGAGHLHRPLDDPVPPSVATPATSNTWCKYAICRPS